MKILKDGIDPGLFFSSLALSENRILLLDYDGTLAPFRAERDKAVPYGGVNELLDRLMRLDRCRTVFITGRSTHDLKALLDLEMLPELWGSHGFERLLPNGSYSAPVMDRRLLSALEEIKGIFLRNGFSDNCETKPFSIAVHWRGIPEDDRNTLEDLVESSIAPIARRDGLIIRRFRGGLEILLPGMDKGTAVSGVLDPYQGKFSAAYLGDDRTDEDAFIALKGKGLSVLVTPELRDTEADIWIRPPSELLDFLGKWVASCGGGP